MLPQYLIQDLLNTISPFHEFCHDTPSCVIPPVTESTNTPVTESTNTSPPVPTAPAQVTRPIRHRQLPSKYKDFTGLPSLPSTSAVVSKPSCKSCAYPLSSVMSYDKFSPSYQQFLCASASIATPHTYSQASKDANWLQAMKLELHALESNNTWALVPKTP